MFEGEGRDRNAGANPKGGHIGLALPGEQTALALACIAANPKTIVVLIHGGMVYLDAIAATGASIVTALYPGQEGGDAVWDVLTGERPASGKLPYTWSDPLSLPIPFPSNPTSRSSPLPPSSPSFLWLHHDERLLHRPRGTEDLFLRKRLASFRGVVRVWVFTGTGTTSRGLVRRSTTRTYALALASRTATSVAILSTSTGTANPSRRLRTVGARRRSGR